MKAIATDADVDEDEGPGGAPLTSEVPHRLVVPREVAADRLDKVLAALIPTISRSRIRSWIDGGAVTVNNQPTRARDVVGAGDAIVLQPLPAPEDGAFEPEQMPLDIVYEDRALLVINKPAGLVVHPAAGHWSGTLVNGLLAFDAKQRALPRAGIVHRLDAATSGLMVVARSLAAHASLVRQLQARTVTREYWAVVFGTTLEQGVIDVPIGRDLRNPLRFRTRSAGSAKEARTQYRRLASVALDAMRFSWLACKLDTGRTHQIRVHLESIRHPIVGDPIYRLHRPTQRTDRTFWVDFPRQALHAVRLELDHPRTGKRMAWQNLPPSDMGDLMRRLGFSLPRVVKSAFGEGS